MEIIAVCFHIHRAKRVANLSGLHGAVWVDRANLDKIYKLPLPLPKEEKAFLDIRLRPNAFRWATIGPEFPPVLQAAV